MLHFNERGPDGLLNGKSPGQPSKLNDVQRQAIAGMIKNEIAHGRTVAKTASFHRVKNGIPSVHPIRGDEMRALRKLRRNYPKDAYVFVSERGGPITHRFPPAHPAPRGGRQDAIPNPPPHGEPAARSVAVEFAAAEELPGGGNLISYKAQPSKRRRPSGGAAGGSPGGVLL